MHGSCVLQARQQIPCIGRNTSAKHKAAQETTKVSYKQLSGMHSGSACVPLLFGCIMYTVVLHGTDARVPEFFKCILPSCTLFSRRVLPSVDMNLHYSSMNFLQEIQGF
jgi:hypothetical protein